MKHLRYFAAAAVFIGGCGVLPALAQAPTARYTLDLSWKDVAFTNSMALAELAIVEVRNIGNATPEGLIYYLSDREGTAMALGTNIVAGTVSNSSVGVLNLQTSELRAFFAGLNPYAERTFSFSVWDSANDILLGSGPVAVRNNPLADQLLTGWTNVPEVVESELLAAIAGLVAMVDAGDTIARADISSLQEALYNLEIGGVNFGTGDHDAARGDWFASLSNAVDSIEVGGVDYGTNSTTAYRGDWGASVSNLAAQAAGWGDHAEAGYALSSALLGYLPSAQAATQYLSVAAAASAYQPLGAYGTNSTTAYRGDWGDAVSNLAAWSSNNFSNAWVRGESVTNAVDSTARAGVTSNATSILAVGVVASNAQAAITSAVYVVGASGEVIQWGSDAANAIRSMSENDTTHISEGDFSLGTNQYVIPSGASIAGAGMYKTRISSEIGSISQDMIVQSLFLCTSNNTFSDFSASAPATTTNSYASIFGDHSEYFTGVEIRRVHAFSRSDSLFFGHSGTNGVGYSRRLTATDSHFESEFDAAVIRPAGEYVFENCTFKSLGPNEYPGSKREAGVIIGSTVMPGQYDVRLQDCTVIARDGQNGVFGVGVYATGATVRVESTSFDVSGTGVVWQINAAYGAVYVAGGNVETGAVYGNTFIRETNIAYAVVRDHAAAYLPLAGHNGPVVLGTRTRGYAASTNLGDYGAAFGGSTKAGNFGAAFGEGSTAGNHGAAFGSSTAGDYGAAFGADTSAGDYGFAAGLETSAGNFGFAAGDSASAGDAGFAAGSGTSAGEGGFAAGTGTSAGNYGFAAGSGTSAGEGGFAAGFDTYADDAGFAAGLETSAGYAGFAAGENTSAGDYGFAAGLVAKGADGSFVFADNSTGGTPFNRTNRPNEFSARAAGGVYFDTPLMAVTGTVSAGSFAAASNVLIGGNSALTTASTNAHDKAARDSIVAVGLVASNAQTVASNATTAAEAGQIATNVASGYLPLAGHNGPVVLGTRTRGYSASTNLGEYGFAAGANTSAGEAGFAAGFGTSASDYGFAAGSGTSAGEYGFAAGEGTTAGPYGFAAGLETSAGTYGFAAGRAAKGADGSFVFADSTGGTPFNRTNRPNEFSARAAGGVYFDTPLMAVTGTVSAGSFALGDGNGRYFLNSSGTSWLTLDGTNLMMRATNGVTGRVQMIYE